jgi:hypothetical protein
VSSNPQEPKSDPSMRPTSISVLIVAGLAAAALGWLLISFSYGSLPDLPWSPVIVLIVLAIAELLLAQNTSARIQRKPGTLPVDPLAVARYAALAKASSLVGAISVGFSAGLVIYLVLEPTDAAHADLPKAVGGLISALALIGAGLWLERACRVPEKPDAKDENDSDRPTGHR